MGFSSRSVELPALAWRALTPGARGLAPVLLLAFWVVAHPWTGLRHDGILYAAQAMLHLQPDVFRGDLFFAWGSQDDYTLFGRIYAAAVAGIGLNHASRLLWAVSQALWFAVAIAWIGRIVSPAHLLPAAVAVFALPAYYGGDLVFRVAETFVTARSFAEPLTLAGLLACVLERRMLGLLLLILASAMHPIMALPGVFCCALFLFAKRLPAGAFAWGTLLPVVASGLALAALLSLSGGIARIDRDWYECVVLRSPFIDPLSWQPDDWMRTLLPLAILALVSGHSAPRWTRVWRVLTVCGIAGLGLAVLASSTRWELGMQAQFWRLVWPAVWAAPVAALGAIQGLREDEGATRAMLWAVIPALVLTSQAWWHASLVLSVAYVLFLACFLCGVIPRTRIATWTAVALAVALCGFALAGGLLLGYVLIAYADPQIYQDSSGVLLVIERFGWLVLPALGLAAWRLESGFGPIRKAMLAATACGLAFAATVNGRSPSAVQLDHLVTSGLGEWTKAIPSDATVFWPDHVGRVWFVLGRRSYVSRAQTAGGVFAREASLEASRRMENVAMIGGSDAVSRFRHTDMYAVRAAITRSDLERACADPALDFVVLTQPFEPRAAAPYVDPHTRQAFHLHRCTDFRAP